MITKKISDIDSNNKESWSKNIYITLDFDWCSDAVLSHCLTLLNQYNIKSTLFVTHHTALIDDLKKDDRIELGIHPNFNFLLNGNLTYGKNSSEVIDYFKKLVPDAISVRSHSLTQSSVILDEFERHGFMYDLNTYIPYHANYDLKPWQHWKGNMIKIPFFWEDDLQCKYNNLTDPISDILSSTGLKVFNFHPIHLFLNTESLNRYENAKIHMNNHKKLVEFENQHVFGVRDFFCKLCEIIS